MEVNEPGESSIDPIEHPSIAETKPEPVDQMTKTEMKKE